MPPTLLDPPKEDLYRAFRPDVLFRAAGPDAEDAPDDGRLGTLFGHFTRYGEWVEIDSWWEGHFLERFASGAFKKTIRERGPKGSNAIRSLFQHGFDFQVGDKPIGPIEQLRDEAEGPYYEVPMLDTSYNHDILPGIEAGVYGVSHRFSVKKESWDKEPAKSDHNPAGLPERTITEAFCWEFGPVTFPAMASASVDVRSITDHMIERILRADPRRLAMLSERFGITLPTPQSGAAPSTPGQGAGSEASEPREHSSLSAAERRKVLMAMTIGGSK